MEHRLSCEELDFALGDHAPFLMSLSDGLQEELHIVISAVEVENLGDNIPDFEEVDETTRQALQGILAKSRPIEANENCLFEICFHDYIIYQIRNESFWSGDPNEIRHGKYLVTFEKSKILSHLEEITDAQQLDDGSFYPGKWIHYGIYTQNHVIDVISHCPPDVPSLEVNTIIFRTISGDQSLQKAHIIGFFMHLQNFFFYDIRMVLVVSILKECSYGLFS